MLEGRSFSGHERNCAYLNCGSSPEAQGRFANVSAASGIDFPDDGRALVTTEWDQDGDLYIWIANRNAPRIRFRREPSFSSYPPRHIHCVANQESYPLA